MMEIGGGGGGRVDRSAQTDPRLENENARRPRRGHAPGKGPGPKIHGAGCFDRPPLAGVEVARIGGCCHGAGPPPALW